MTAQRTTQREPDDATTGTEPDRERTEPARGPKPAPPRPPATGESIEDDTVPIVVYRYDPDVEGKQKPYYDTFHVPREPGQTVLDTLIYARDHYDSTLTFRHSCRQAICGSDGFLVNGTQRLGCNTQVSGLDEPIRIEPLPYFDVCKDLVVEMDGFYDSMDAIEPYFQSSDDPPGPLEERRQSRENREEIKMASRCIWCGCCSSSCTIFGQGGNFHGPAAINYAARFVMDERESDDVTDHRLDLLDQTEGVWRCQTQFSCTEVCPKDIPITEHIQKMKREAVKQNMKFW
ncbi:MAG: succinate dehydrogenase/fumarate reductase iron-sulfur subunit [Halorientalis sp.]